MRRTLCILKILHVLHTQPLYSCIMIFQVLMYQVRFYKNQCLGIISDLTLTQIPFHSIF